MPKYKIGEVVKWKLEEQEYSGEVIERQYFESLDNFVYLVKAKGYAAALIVEIHLYL